MSTQFWFSMFPEMDWKGVSPSGCSCHPCPVLGNSPTTWSSLPNIYPAAKAGCVYGDCSCLTAS